MKMKVSKLLVIGIVLLLMLVTTPTMVGRDINIEKESLQDGEVNNYLDNNPPYIPSNPIPPDGATNVSSGGICWTGGDPDDDPVTYDVYLGNTSPPPKISSNLPANCTNPGFLKINTTYYWRIVAWDNHGASTAGPIWHFTTGINYPPNKPEIHGETQPRVGLSYAYDFISDDLDGDNVSYYIEWGDGNITDWTPFQTEGFPGYKESHSWDEIGTYTLRAKAKDIWGAESDWMYVSLKVPKSKQIIDREEHYVSFTKPENGIYHSDKKILPFIVPLIWCGNITIEVEIESTSEIDRIEFYVDDALHYTIMHPEPTYEFTIEWGGSSFSRTKFAIIAYAFDNTQANDEIVVWRIFSKC